MNEMNLSSIVVERKNEQSLRNDNEELPPTKPKRPLSAYNFFFKHERGKILADTPVRDQGKPRRSHGKIGFGPLARIIADKWKKLDDEGRKYFKELADVETTRYKKEKKQWKKEMLTRCKQDKKQWKKALMIERESRKKAIDSLLQGAGDDSVSIQTNNYVESSITQCSSSALNNDVASTMKEVKERAEKVSSDSFDLIETNIQLPVIELCFPHTQGPRSPFFANEEPASSRNHTAKENKHFALLSHHIDVENEMNYTIMGTTSVSCEQNLLDVSELAAKLDDDCIDLLLSGW